MKDWMTSDLACKSGCNVPQPGCPCWLLIWQLGVSVDTQKSIRATIKHHPLFKASNKGKTQSGCSCSAYRFITPWESRCSCTLACRIGKKVAHQKQLKQKKNTSTQTDPRSVDDSFLSVGEEKKQKNKKTPTYNTLTKHPAHAKQ